MKQILTLLCLLFLLSCASMTKDGTEAITRPFSEVDSERKIVLSVGRTFEIVLPSNPTTGYSWTLLSDQPNVVENQSHQYVADASGRVGVGGRTTWTLKARSHGEAILTFTYQRPWEENVPPTKTVTFTISVR